MRKQIVYILTLLLLFFFGLGQVNAIKIVSKETFQMQQKEVSLGESFNFLASFLDDKIPESYKYIQLNIRGVNKNSEFYKSLQKMIYLDIIKNKNIYLNENKKISKYYFYKLAEKIFNVELINSTNIEKYKNEKLKNIDLENFKNLISNSKVVLEFTDQNQVIAQKKEIFLDVYSTLKNKHYNKDNIDELEMLNYAIEGLTKGTNDKFTTYFPPVDNKKFNESLSGEYEGIGAYVEMQEPGVLKIISPISGSPAEKAGLKGGDVILKVDGKEVEKDTGLTEAISWIKGKSGTKVVLTVKRGTKIFDITVVRGKIVIKEVEYKLLNRNTFYIKLKFFGPTISKDFKEALEKMNEYKYVNKVIIDLRNNPGGYLGQVTDMLSNFAKKGEPVAVVKYYDSQRVYKSRGYDILDFSKYKIVILQNSGSASASEIMIGGIKDYYPDAVSIGEKTYGKGSVQTIKDYVDGSSLKYTIAKWYTGKSETGIDGIGIEADIKIEDNVTDNKRDKILDKAIRLK